MLLVVLVIMLGRVLMGGIEVGINLLVAMLSLVVLFMLVLFMLMLFTPVLFTPVLFVLALVLKFGETDDEA